MISKILYLFEFKSSWVIAIALTAFEDARADASVLTPDWAANAWSSGPKISNQYQILSSVVSTNLHLPSLHPNS